MNQMWQAWYQGLNDGQVQNIINACKKYPIQDATIGDSTVVQDNDYRRSEIRWINSFLEKELVDLIWYYVREANRAAFGFDIDYMTEIQYTEYHAKNLGKYDWHVDTFWANPRCYDRKLSVTIQLTDGYEYQGGDFQFDPSIPALDPLAARKKGTILVFPSFLSHRVTPVTQGTRSSLVAWVEGPKFR